MAMDRGAREGLVDFAFYRDGRRHQAGSLSEALELAARHDDGFVWLGLHQPSADEFQHIAAAFGLHPLAVEDAIHAHQRPKVEVYGESLFAVLKTARYVDTTEVIDLGEIMVFMGHNFVISVRHGEASHLADVRADLETRPDVLSIGPSAVLWAVADRVVDDYVVAISGFGEDVEQVEAAVFDPAMRTPTERIYKLKREMLEFRRAIEPLVDALDPIVEGRVPVIDEHTREYFRDVQDHAMRDGSRLVSYDELLSNALQANIAQVSLRQNEDMRKITAWAAILAVVTSIAGIYGMNFEHMPELAWRYGYFICLGVMLLASVTLYVTFRRRKWL